MEAATASPDVVVLHRRVVAAGIYPDTDVEVRRAVRPDDVPCDTRAVRAPVLARLNKETRGQDTRRRYLHHGTWSLESRDSQSRDGLP